MKANRILTVAWLVALPVVPSLAITLTPIASRTQVVNYTQGAPTLVSPGKSIASATVVPEANGHVVLFVAVQNKTRRNVNLGVENVSAAAGGAALRVFTYDELARKIQTGGMWQKFALAAGAGLRAGAAVQPARSTFGGTYDGNGYRAGQYHGNFNGYSTTTDPTQQALAQSAITADTRAQTASLDAQQNQKLAALQTILRTTTVQPGQMYGGIIELAKPRAPTILSVGVAFGAEQHVFSFQVSR